MVPKRTVFDYLGQKDAPLLLRGTRVKVPFGRRTLVGVIVRQIATSSHAKQLKTLEGPCESFPLFSEEFCQWIESLARYYHHPLGEVFFTGAPLALRQGKALPEIEPALAPAGVPVVVLNADQQKALQAIEKASNQFQPFLLEGITGSGKTEVYLQAAQAFLAKGQQVLILVPEISLTLQTQQRFIERFGDNVVCYHSRKTPAQRFKTWSRVRAQTALVVVGTRSALFLPFTRLGIIIIDEEHSVSFKQQEGFRYSARDAAVLRAKLGQFPIVLGSATPAFETVLNAQMGKYQRLHLPMRATQVALPSVTLLDTRHKKCEGGLSGALLQRIAEQIAQGGQILLFINRRGYAPTMMCFSCGWVANCTRCDARLTYHHKSQTLRCHHCAAQCALPEICPGCNASVLQPLGQGTERVEQVLKAHFPDVVIDRIDSDATQKKGELERLLARAHDKESTILIGTQMLAKGHHFPHLRLVAIVDADAGLFSVDFRAQERMGQLLIQVAGRAGRVHVAGEVVIQTAHPEHPLLRQMLEQNYATLSLKLLAERKTCRLPPFSHWALIRAQAPCPIRAQKVLCTLQESVTLKGVELLGPVPAPMLKRQGQFRYQLLMQSVGRQGLHQALARAMDFLERSALAKKVRWSLDVDPVEIV